METDRRDLSDEELESTAGGTWFAEGYTENKNGTKTFKFKNSGGVTGAPLINSGGNTEPITLEYLRGLGMSSIQAKSLLRHLAEPGNAGDTFEYTFVRGRDFPFFAHDKIRGLD